MYLPVECRCWMNSPEATDTVAGPDVSTVLTFHLTQERRGGRCPHWWVNWLGNQEQVCGVDGFVHRALPPLANSPLLPSAENFTFLHYQQRKKLGTSMWGPLSGISLSFTVIWRREDSPWVPTVEMLPGEMETNVSLLPHFQEDPRSKWWRFLANFGSLAKR